MKLINYTSERKEYGGNFYTEFSLQLQDGNMKRLVKVTGKVPVIAIDANGVTSELGRLDKCGLTANADIVFWFDLKDRITMIEVHTGESAPPLDDHNSFIPF